MIEPTVGVLLCAIGIVVVLAIAVRLIEMAMSWFDSRLSKHRSKIEQYRER